MILFRRCYRPGFSSIIVTVMCYFIVSPVCSLSVVGNSSGLTRRSAKSDWMFVTVKSKASAYFLSMSSDNGKVVGSGNETQGLEVVIQRNAVGGAGSYGNIMLESILTCRYYCMNRKRKVYSSYNASDECIFKEVIDGHYVNYLSKKYSTKRKDVYLALNRKGQPKGIAIRNTAKGLKLDSGRILNSKRARLQFSVVPFKNSSLVKEHFSFTNRHHRKNLKRLVLETCERTRIKMIKKMNKCNRECQREKKRRKKELKKEKQMRRKKLKTTTTSEMPIVLESLEIPSYITISEEEAFSSYSKESSTSSEASIQDFSGDFGSTE